MESIQVLLLFTRKENFWKMMYIEIINPGIARIVVLIFIGINDNTNRYAN
jgi:hypothetical protein